MLSTSDVVVMGSKLVLVTVTVNRKVPPGSGRLVGSGVLMIWIEGGTLVMVTVALAFDTTSWPRSLRPVVVIVSVWAAPALPKKLPVKMQLYVPPFGASLAPTAHVPRPFRSP